MPIIYSVIARSRTVLSEYAVSRTGNVSVVAKDILSKLPDFDTRKTYTAEGVCFHVLIQNGITYLCVADMDFGASKPFAFLTNISSDFSSRYGDRALTAQAYEMNNDFSRILGKQMEFYSSDPNSDRITRVKQQVDDVKQVMVSTIEKVLERGDKIEELVDKTTTMQAQSFKFQDNAKKVKRHFWWKNCKLWVVVIIIAIIALYLLVSGFACGGPHLPNCINHNNNNNNNNNNNGGNSTTTSPVAPPFGAPPVAPPVAKPPPPTPPVAAPVRPPVRPPVAAPVRPPVAAPVRPPVSPPVAAPVAPPVAAPELAPIDPPTEPIPEPFSVPEAAPVSQQPPVESPQTAPA